MNHSELGRIENVDIREIWKSEERDFSPWLKENIGFITEKISIGVEDLKLEQDVGRYSTDLVGKVEGTNNTIIIENQFGETDHDHLGKLLTYMSGKGARVGVWVAEKFREEHIATLEYLNETTSRENGPIFFGLEITVKRIGNSVPAPEFNIVVKPNEWQRTISQEPLSEADIERQKMRVDFFSKLADRYKEINPSWNRVKPQPQNWLSFGSGVSGLKFGWVFKSEFGYRFVIELYIDTVDKEENKRIVTDLKSRRIEIEGELGSQLDFQELPHARASRIELSTPTGIAFTKLSDEKKEELIEWGAKNMLTFSKVLSRYIKEVI